MIALSLNEVETLAAKVGRGAGLPWGLAEELSRGARRLAEAGLPWADALAVLAEGCSSWAPPSPARVAVWRARRDEPSGESLLCPLRLAIFLMDDPAILAAGALSVERVAAPIWLAGVLAPARGEPGYRVDWDGVAFETYACGVARIAGDGDALAPRARVTIAPLAGDRVAAPPRGRAEIDAATLRALSAVAERTYVAASETSRVRGAGGGSVDDD